MNIIEAVKRILPALALMAVCSAAILYLPQWNRDTETPPNTASDASRDAPPPAPQERGDQA